MNPADGEVQRALLNPVAEGQLPAVYKAALKDDAEVVRRLSPHPCRTLHFRCPKQRAVISRNERQVLREPRMRRLGWTFALVAWAVASDARPPARSSQRSCRCRDPHRLRRRDQPGQGPFRLLVVVILRGRGGVRDRLARGLRPRSPRGLWSTSVFY
jgi:hypothetical protein